MKSPQNSRHTRFSRVSEFAHRLLGEWRRLKLPASNSGVIVAVSGGADSTALVLALAELGRAQRLKLQVVVAHLDHGLRNGSEKDAEWVIELADQLGYEAVSGRANVMKLARAKSENLEQAARQARYEFLLKTAKRKKALMVLTAHTMDDQAETFMLRLLRGSGAEGLSGIEPIRSITSGSEIKLVRPLITWARRADTENYCRALRIDFRADQMNEDERFARVRVRKQLLPLMQSFNSRIVEALDRTANLLREDSAVLSFQANRLLEAATENPRQNDHKSEFPCLNVKILVNAPPAVLRRAIREWIMRARGDLRRLEMVHVIAVEQLLKGSRGGRVAQLPGGVNIYRKGNQLELRFKKS